jgi:hypothetical protein
MSKHNNDYYSGREGVTLRNATAGHGVWTGDIMFTPHGRREALAELISSKIIDDI